jgi:hypothetical protein
MPVMVWTTVIAIYAVLVSTGSLAVAILAWRSSGPQLKAEAGLARIIVKGEDHGQVVEVGLAPEVGPTLPHRLLSHSSVT